MKMWCLQEFCNFLKKRHRRLFFSKNPKKNADNKFFKAKKIK